MDRRHWGLAVVMGGIHFTFHVFVRLIPPLIPVLAVALDYPLWKLGLLVSGYFAGSSVGLLPMGSLSDRYDRQVLLSGTLAVVGAGYVLFSVAPELGATVPTVTAFGYTFDGPFTVMVLAMLVAGLGTSAHIPVGVPLLTANADERNRGKLLGIWGGGSKLGDAAAPAMVGVLILSLEWQEITLGFGIAGIVAAVLLFLVLGFSSFNTKPAAQTDDTDEETTDIWRTDRRRYLYPILVLMGYFAAYNLVVQGTVTFVPVFITDVYGYTAAAAGVSFTPESFADFALSALLIGGAVSRFIGGALVDQYDHRMVLFGSLLVAFVALTGFSVFSLGPFALVAVLVVFGVGLWGNSPARDSLISVMTPDEREGRTFSYLWTASRVFGAISPAVIGFMADSAGIRLGFQYLAVATLVAALFVALLFSERVYRRDAPERTETEAPSGD
jgi:MFS family permease